MKKQDIENYSAYMPPEARTTPEAIKQDIKRISNSAIVDGILRNTDSLIAILDTNRQVISVNQELLDKLGIKDKEEVFGLRPGEVLRCIHADEEKGGCGHSKFCPSCGAAIAISLAQIEQDTIERICIVRIRKNNRIEDAYFKVRANMIFHAGRWYILLFLQDYTINQRRATLERMFYHDINNIVSGLVGSAELLNDLEKANISNNKNLRYIVDSAIQLSREILLHRAMQEKKSEIYHKTLEKISIKKIIDKAVSIIRNSASAKDKTITVSEAPEFVMYLDVTVVLKILNNMLKNALEASGSSAEIEIWSEMCDDDGNIKFHVWNDAFIPEEYQHRIFQKNFSTNPELGRGLGTYSMKYFAKHFLDGDVYFVTSEKEGTRFTLSIPFV